jgi:transcriptional regulator
MYTPRANQETRLPVLREMIAAHPLAAVVTLGSTGLTATHIPLVYEEDGTPYGILRGHVSRANTQWKDISPGVDALIIFSGPQHYISAGWYPGKLEDGKEVPTWNYVTVHASGPLRIVQDPAWLLSHLESLTGQHEATFPTPWKVSDAPVDFIASQLKGIVGFEIPIRTLEGKWKTSQNRDQRDREAVISGLTALGSPESGTMARLVEETTPKKL